MSDAAENPLLVLIAEPAASLTSNLRRPMPHLRAIVGDQRRVLVGFDCRAWSPALFADLHSAGFNILTRRNGAAADIDEHAFTEHSHTDEHAESSTLSKQADGIFFREDD